MKRLIRAENTEVKVDIVPCVSEKLSSGGNFKSYFIEATLDGEKVGRLTLFAYENCKGEEVSRNFAGEIVTLLYFEDFEVDKNRRGQGIANSILKKLGELYNQKFQGWPLYNMYINPIAEYAVLNAISKGWLPQEALLENYTGRGLAYADEQLLVDLRNKLPEEYKDKFAPGPGGLWSRK